MNRASYVLAAMAAAGAKARFDPVRLQKFFFLLDRELDGECGCPHFEFRPYHYGPFDQAVYGEVESLSRQGLASVDDRRRYRLYGLTEEGFTNGARALAGLPERARGYMAEASGWIFSLDFRDLLAAIYEYAPDMAVRSVLPSAVPAPRPDSEARPFVRGMARAFEWPGLPNRRGRTRRDAGAAALGRQWAAVGDRLRAAMAQTAHVRDDQ